MKGVGILVVATAGAYSQSISQVLSRYSQLSKLSSYISTLPQLSSLLTAANNFTFLAPTDDAISSWLATAPSISNSTIEATLTYHLLNGGHPFASFSNRSNLISTALSNATYANVTNGQRVEGKRVGSGVEFTSWNKKTSKVTTADVISTGGLIHIIDSVLNIPQDELTTIAAANLSYFINIIAQGNYITLNNGAYVQHFDTMADATFFAPNSAAALASFNTTGFNQSMLNTLFEYHVFPGLMYSTNFTNGTTLITAAGIPVLVTVDDQGSIYLNTAKIIMPDYLISNGVMQVLDSVLNPTNITRPTFPPATSSSTTNTTIPAPNSPAPTPQSSSKDLSKGGIAGIVVGICLAAIIALLIAFYFLRQRRKAAKGKEQKNSEEMDKPKLKPELSNNGILEIPQLDTEQPPAEVGEPLRHELDT
ncbi:FAS1 domain-containing protein [Halenospora varia]|nr:FAS1 domain-containing protein [Halenospora varia]